MWTFEHSVECKVERAFAWQFWTDISNWPLLDPSVESAVLEGPFQSGAKVSTKARGGEPIHGRLENVQDGRGATVVIPVPGAALRCAWKFEDFGIRKTRITQKASIEGERALDYVPTAAPELEKGIPAGMQKLAEYMELLDLGSALGRWFCMF
jgi:hypothetical protein